MLCSADCAPVAMRKSFSLGSRGEEASPPLSLSLSLPLRRPVIKSISAQAFPPPEETALRAPLFPSSPVEQVFTSPAVDAASFLPAGRTSTRRTSHSAVAKRGRLHTHQVRSPLP